MIISTVDHVTVLRRLAHCLYLFSFNFILFYFRPDVTVMVDWGLKINYLSILFALFYTLVLSLSGNSGSLTWDMLQQPQEQRYPILQVHAGSFRVSVIHRTLTWTAGPLTCVRDHSNACTYTRGGWAHRQRVDTTFLTRKNSHNCFLDLLTGFYPRVFGPRVRRSTH